MMNRRGALAAIGAAAFGGIDWLISKSHRLRQAASVQGSFRVFGAELANPAADDLAADLTRLGARVYSEEGIPMFLACENLAGAPTSQERPPSPSPLNKRVAAAFRRYADGWQRLHPDAPASDVNRIVEFLADEDFASGGNEKRL